MAALVAEAEFDWSRVDVLHMNEYVGFPATHPASFLRALKEHLVDRVHPGRTEYLCVDAEDLHTECRRYGESLHAGRMDVCFVGIGANGHIAFNDPHEVDFEVPQ